MLSRAAKIAIALATASISVGAWIFSLTQHVAYITAFYWAMTTAATVGYGDIHPVNVAGQVIAIMVMLIAIPSLGTVFALITSEITHRKNKEHLEKKFKHMEQNINGKVEQEVRKLQEDQ